MSARFQTFPSPNPDERQFRLVVDDVNMRPEDLPVKGTTYGAWTFGGKERLDDTAWQSYVYLMSEVSSPGTSSFVFGKARTLEEALVPFETWTTNEMHRWDAELEALAYLTFGADESFYPKSLFYPAFECMSLVKVELFLHTDPFPSNTMRHQQPMPGEVQGISGECLHDEVVVEEGRNEGYVRYDLGSHPERIMQGRKQVIPRTNFVRNRTFVKSDVQQQTQGMFLRERKTVYFPRRRRLESFSI